MLYNVAAGLVPANKRRALSCIEWVGTGYYRERTTKGVKPKDATLVMFFSFVIVLFIVNYFS
ncbi:hypothetical protein KKE26_07740 [bacterium]|nr:hypothetical protein [bacterium]